MHDTPTARPVTVHELRDALSRSHQGWALDLSPEMAEHMATNLLADFHVHHRPDATTKAAAAIDLAAVPLILPPPPPPGPRLEYVSSPAPDGCVMTTYSIDRTPITDPRERTLCRGLLVHALTLLDTQEA
ncbi:hypothetical protein [Streptomyces sp. NPDC102437]|uniref:hypothetical protein n=1 Tax=Streptomyces sp. NPDC102437 TaxID=3366175 RepID=UPI0038065890